MKLMILILVALRFSTSDTSRILCLAPYPGRSHWIVMEPLFQELAARGHQVTVFSVFPQKKPLLNYTDIDFSAQLPPVTSSFSLEYIKEKLPNPWVGVQFINDVHKNACQKVIEEPDFLDLLKSKGKYDVVITELFGDDCFAYFAYKLGIPLISITTSVNLPWASDRTGLPDNPAYIPNYHVDFAPQMTLWERIYNTVVLCYAKYMHLQVYSKNTQAMVEKAFGESLPPVSEVVANTSVLFLNSHFSFSQARPFPPNVIEVGGIHIKDRQPLPQDLKSIMDNADKGVILMSFGSLVRTSTIPKTAIMKFMRAFAKIPQIVIFKYEEELPEAPPNVITRKWLPQRDMAEHRNVKALLVHGGLASTIEAVHFGKPIIGIPFFSDQYLNLNAIARRGAGVLLVLDNLSEDKIKTAVNEIMNNPKYSENMKKLSSQFRDRPQTPLQTAVYWTEYVIRHQGAPHLRPASVSLPFYQYLLLDVIAVLIASVIAFLYTVYVSVGFLKSLIFDSKSSKCKEKLKRT